MGYVYRHIRLDNGNPFYIGISNDSSGLYKRAFSKEVRNNLWQKIIKKSNYEVEIIFEHDDYEFIKEKEKELISLYGRINANTGILSNLTDGGEGTLGYIQSKEMVNNRIAKTTGQKRTQEQKDYMSLKMKGVKRSVQSCENISKSKLGHSNNKGIPKTLEHKLKLKEGKLELFKNKENHPMYGKKGELSSRFGKKHSEESIEKMKGRPAVNRKKVIDTNTGIIYNSATEAALMTGTTKSAMLSRISGRTKSYPNFKYYIKKGEV
jgi:hypothetical protein